MPVAVIGQFRLPPERLTEARGAMERVVTATLGEAGCLAYSYAEDVLDPGLIRVSELWESRAHLAAHFAAPHMARWQEERAALGLTGRQVTAYELGAAEAL
ncbi:quinol monooxygenase YgiN [Novosphingobium kunmingense]|uniref:Quinol monooxygenase YgiN n=1 Tax=Novosphingobium kunmingense TaxID=1211806 RepID=A0A2N0I443_9SPHN|nr:putative quinol monooxygenase [Novosphingobium kunmingense]PKB25950.1 quinol monooxygenase YgiN [Novosphingobium kunmingense]